MNFTKKIALFFLSVWPVAAFGQSTLTPNLSLQVPSFQQQNWQVPLNYDLGVLDSILGGSYTLVPNAATPTVLNHSNWLTANAISTAITNFSNGYQGQTIRIFCGDGNTTMASGTNLSLQAPFDCTSQTSITLTLIGTIWTESSRTPSGGGGSGNPGGSPLQAQVNQNGSAFGGTPCQTFASVAAISTGPLQFGCDSQFSINPYYDVRNFHVRSVSPSVVPQIAGITSNCTSGSAQVTLSSASTFQNGDGVSVFNCGAAQTMLTPVISTVTPMVARVGTGTGDAVPGPTGATTYNYKVVMFDENGGFTAASTAVSTTTGAATLGFQSATISSCTRSNATVTCTTTSPHGYLVGCGSTSCGMAHIVGTSDSSFLGEYTIASAPNATTFTYTGGMTTVNGAPTSSTGGTVTWYNENQITISAIAGGYQACLYSDRVTPGTFALIMCGLPLNPKNSQMTKQSLVFDDFGASMSAGYIAHPLYVPTTAPSSATNDNLSTTIVSGAGTTTLTLANTASTNQTGVTILFDSAPLLKSLFTTAAGAPVYLPNNMFPLINSNLDLTGISQGVSIVGGNNLVLRGTILLNGSSSWTGSVFPFVGSQGSFTATSNITVQCDVSPCIYEVSNTSDQISNMQLTPLGNDQVMFLADGGGGSPYGTFKNLYFSNASNDLMNMNVYLRGASDFSGSGGGNFFNLNLNGAQGHGGQTETPLMYANGAVVNINGLYASGRGVLFKNDPAGGQILINGGHVQGSFTPIVTMSTQQNGSFESAIVENYTVDTTAAPIITNLGSIGIGNVVATVANLAGGPASGFPVFSGLPMTTVNGSSSGQNTACIAGLNFCDNPVSVFGAGAFMTPISNSTAPTAAVSAGGSVPVGTFQYGITVLDAAGNQSTLSPTVSATTTTGNQTVTITPPAAPIGAVGWNVYRNNALDPGCASFNIPFSSVFVDTFNFTCGVLSPLTSRAAAVSLGPAGVASQTLALTNSGFVTQLTPSLSASQTVTLPSNSGFIPVTGYQNSAYDTFNRANGGLGANWTTTSGLSAPQIASNVVASQASATGAFWSASPMATDQFSQVTMATASGVGYVSLQLRTSGTAATYYRCAAKGTGGIDGIYQVIAGTQTALAATSNITYAVGDVLRCQIQGSTITFLKNDVSQATFTVTSGLITGGSPGLQLAAGAGISVEDWSGGGIHPIAQLDIEQDWLSPQHFLPSGGLTVGPSTNTPITNMTFQSCGTTTTCAETQQGSFVTLTGGPIALVGGTITITSLPYTSATTYVCSVVDSTALNPLQAVYNSGASVTFNGTTTDSIRYSCVGN